MRDDLVEFLIERSPRAGKTVVAYGAPGKGNTLLNHCGVRGDLIAFAVDRNPFKHGKFLPGHPHPDLRPPSSWPRRGPTTSLIMPWNLRDEIAAQLDYVRDWGGKLVVALPEARDLLEHGGRTAMKVVLFCGGLGMRMRADNRVAAQADDADRQPSGAVARHALLRPLRPHRVHPLPRLRRPGGQGLLPRLPRDASNDFVLTKGGQHVEMLGTDISDWTITFIDTGIDTAIGERLRRVRPYLEGDEMFLANYGDVLTDAPMNDLIDEFAAHRRRRQFLAVKPQDSFHVVDIDGDGRVTGLAPVADMSMRINGGYFVLRQGIFDYLDEGDDLVMDGCRARPPRTASSRAVRTTASGRRWTPSRSGRPWRTSTGSGVSPWALWRDEPVEPGRDRPGRDAGAQCSAMPGSRRWRGGGTP